MTVQVNVTSSPGQTASPLSTDEVKIKQSMTDINQYMHDTTTQCKSEDIVNVVRRYRLKNFQLLFLMVVHRDWVLHIIIAILDLIVKSAQWQR